MTDEVFRMEPDTIETHKRLGILDRFLSRLSESQHPMLARLRDFVKQSAAAHSAARGLLKPFFLVRRTVRAFFRLRHVPRRLALAVRFCFRDVSQWLWPPPFSAKAAAFADARATGGAISLQELEVLWEATARCRNALCIAEGAELEQL